ncbi:type II toxin-antitoxin system RelE/ParE family toxin [Rhizobium sp. LjRoot30]|uniref:type II toxin-antitoxin system RelE/ParE family toxin n=1 Tax=Rhizobium sp. LjRoot30 TaxID=3342320 RepID=UPI003ECD9EC9
MIEVRQTTFFRDWLDDLTDRRAQERIAQRIVRLKAGLFGDATFFESVGELRIDHGPGYRLYFVRRGNVLVVLLCGGDKSTQAKDIVRAKSMAADLEM